jgi:hypothetical protein
VRLEIRPPRSHSPGDSCYAGAAEGTAPMYRSKDFEPSFTFHPPPQTRLRWGAGPTGPGLGHPTFLPQWDAHTGSLVASMAHFAAPQAGNPARLAIP